MVTIRSSALIHAQLERVYDYATDPGNCCEWYPTTSSVERAAKGPRRRARASASASR